MDVVASLHFRTVDESIIVIANSNSSLVSLGVFLQQNLVSTFSLSLSECRVRIVQADDRSIAVICGSLSNQKIIVDFFEFTTDYSLERLVGSPFVNKGSILDMDIIKGSNRADGVVYMPILVSGNMMLLRYLQTSKSVFEYCDPLIIRDLDTSSVHDLLLFNGIYVS